MPSCPCCYARIGVPCRGRGPRLLQEAVVLLQASRINAPTYEPGDPWENEGTAGSAYNGVMFGDPELVDDNGPAFSLDPADDSTVYIYVPDGPEIDVATGSFTAFAWVRWTKGSPPAFGNIFAKITSNPVIGAGGKGWQIASGTAAGNNSAALACSGGTNPPVDPAAALGGGNLTVGEHLLVMCVNRATQTVRLFVDNVAVASASTTGVGDMNAAHEWIFGRSTAQLGRAYGLWLRALTDDEITSFLPTAIGFP